MKIKIFKVFFLSIFQTVLFCVITYSFSIVDDCLYKEEGTPFSFDVSSPQIDFYIPHNWANNEDNQNHLIIRLFNTNLVLRHPLSTKKESNDVDLPLNEMNIGWNTIYLNKNGRTVQVEIVKINSQNFIKTITILEGISLLLGHHIFKDIFYVSGLYSLVNCFKGNHTTYYKIRAKSNFTMPFILKRRPNMFKALSESSPFTFEVFSSGFVRKVCKKDKMSINSFTIRRECELTELEHVSEFPENFQNNVYVSSDIFVSQDILEYNNSIFTEIVIHNPGNADFYIQIDYWPPTNAPISLLKVIEPTGSTVLPIIPSTLKPFSNNNTSVIPNGNEGKSALVWIIIASVFGVLLVLLMVAFVLLYLKHFYTRLCIQNHAARVDNDFFPEGLEGYVVSAAPQVGIPPHSSNPPGRLNKEEATNEIVVDKSYLVRGSSYFDFDKPVRPNAESPYQIGIPPHASNPPGRLNKEEATDEKYYEEYHYYEKYHPKVNEDNTEEYHYYERYHPELDQDVKPQYENDFPVDIPPHVSNSPGRLNKEETTDENYYEEYHYYEKYHPKANEEAKPQYENNDF